MLLNKVWSYLTAYYVNKLRATASRIHLHHLVNWLDHCEIRYLGSISCSKCLFYKIKRKSKYQDTLAYSRVLGEGRVREITPYEIATAEKRGKQKIRDTVAVFCFVYLSVP